MTVSPGSMTLSSIKGTEMVAEEALALAVTLPDRFV